jgi:hypothetical protein
MKRTMHWQDGVNAGLGAWLIIAPWVLDFQHVTIATTTTMALGALLLACSIEAIAVPDAWEEWLDVAIGIALMLAPALLGFDALPLALVNAMVTGALVVILALWVLGSDDELVASWERAEQESP